MTETTTFMTPFSYVFMAVMSILLIALPRRYAIIPVIITISYMTLGQRLIIWGNNFTIFRILILIGFVRLFFRREFYKIKLNAIEKTFLIWIVVTIITALLLVPTTEMFTNKLGFAYNAIGSFLLFRFLIRDMNDIRTAFKSFAIIIIPLAVTMIIEKSTARNLFSAFGGVPEYTMIRSGRLRCQGPFTHPILSGTFGATILPFFIALWFQKNSSKLVSVMGIVAATIITIASSSSGPAVAYIFGILGFMIWPFRNHMRLIRWLILILLVSLHMMMKAPVWYIFSKLARLIGGTGWHRSEIIDQAISHFNQWWLIGTTYTADWIAYHSSIDPDNADITNQFILEGVRGGVLKLGLFVLLIALCFRHIGRAIRFDDEFTVKIILWALGVSLLVHVISFFSVSYFDQIVVIWYLLLAMISISGNISLKNQTGKMPNPSELNA